MKNLLTLIFLSLRHPILSFRVWRMVFKSLFKHAKLLREYHPNMPEETLQARIMENFKNDLRKYARSLGVEHKVDI